MLLPAALCAAPARAQQDDRAGGSGVSVSEHAAGHPRSAWYLGVGAGLGVGSFVDPLGGRTYSGPAAFVDFQGGLTLSPSFLLGLDLAVHGATDVFDVSNGATLAMIATWFPRSTGFFLRGGGGYSWATSSGERWSSQRTVSGQGVSVTGGTGWAWWIGQSFNLTLGADLSAQWLSVNGGTRNPRYLAIMLGCGWY